VDAGASIPMLMHTHSKERVTGALLGCLLAGLLGAFQFGWATGAINMPQDIIKENLDADKFMMSVVVAAFCVGTFPGERRGWSRGVGGRTDVVPFCLRCHALCPGGLQRSGLVLPSHNAGCCSLMHFCCALQCLSWCGGCACGEG
jgi:hypothetical protein